MESIADRIVRADLHDPPLSMLRATKADALRELDRLRDVIVNMDDFAGFPNGPAGVVLYAFMKTRANVSTDIADFNHACERVEQLLAAVTHALRHDGPWSAGTRPTSQGKVLPCCGAGHAAPLRDLAHVYQFDFDLYQCTRCDTYWVWAWRAGLGGFHPVASADAASMLTVPDDEMRSFMKRWATSFH